MTGGAAISVRITALSALLCLAATVVSSATAASDAPAIAWTRTFAAGEFAAVNDVAFDETGALYATGAAPVDGHRTDLALAKYNATGGLAWRRLLGGGLPDAGVALAIGGNGEIFVAGNASSLRLPAESGDPGGGLILARYNAAGERLWLQRWGDCNRAQADAVVITADSVVAAGTYTGSDSPCLGDLYWFAPQSMVLVSYTLDGRLRWDTHVAQPSADAVLDAAVAGPDGSVLVTGSGNGWHDDPEQVLLTARVNADGRRAWLRQANIGRNAQGTGIAMVSGEVIVAGRAGARGGGSTRFLLTLSADDGSVQDLARIRLEGWEPFLADLVRLRNGDLLVVGAVRRRGAAPGAPTRGWLMRRSPDGAVSWSMAEPPAGNPEWYVAAAEGPGGVIAVADGSRRRAFVRIYK